MSKPLDPHDLAALVRRGNAEPTAVRRLNMALGASPVERELFELGQSYDKLNTSLPEDAALLDRLVSRSLLSAGLPNPAGMSQSAGAGQTGGTQGPPLLATGSKLALAGVAALSIAIGVVAFVSTRQPAAEASAQASAPAVRHVVEAAEQISTASEQAAAPVALRVLAPAAPEAHDSSPMRDGAGKDAERLFRDANALRRSGNLSDATREYRRLQARFPRSAEAAVSRMILGRVLLSEGKPADAYAQFAAYGAGSGHTELAAEALQGQITCAKRMGNKQLEAKACQQLLTRFAGSAYAAAARAGCEGER